ncbi:putative glutamate synthase subunit beta [compost metagenome]
MVNLDGIFVASNTPNAIDFAFTMGLKVKEGKIVLEEDYKTNISGMFACGDVVNDFMQVSTAVGSGAEASKACIRYLIDLKKNQIDETDK